MRDHKTFSRKVPFEIFESKNSFTDWLEYTVAGLAAGVFFGFVTPGVLCLAGETLVAFAFALVRLAAIALALVFAGVALLVFFAAGFVPPNKLFIVKENAASGLFSRVLFGGILL
jgi:hypothetical protein